MKNHSCVFVADFHGNEVQYNKLARYLKEQAIKAVFIGGDLFPKDGGLWHPGHEIRTIATQKKFILNFFIPFLKKVSQNTDVYFIFGNDDFASNTNLFSDLPSNVHFINNKYAPVVDDIGVYGYPFVTISPFLQKDWEKWDNHQEMKKQKHVEQGYFSKDGEHFPIDFSKVAKQGHSLQDDLAKIARQIDVKKTIMLMHEPPIDTHLDQISPASIYALDGNVHIGSQAVRDFIEKEQPLLSFHGHIHETVDESGEYFEKIGNSFALTAGNNFKESQLYFVEVDIFNPSSHRRKVI